MAEDPLRRSLGYYSGRESLLNRCKQKTGTQAANIQKRDAYMNRVKRLVSEKVSSNLRTGVKGIEQLASAI